MTCWPDDLAADVARDVLADDAKAGRLAHPMTLKAYLVLEFGFLDRHASVRRYRPVAHAFSYRLFMMYLDMAELPALFDRRWLWSARHPALARFKREDHLGPPHVALNTAVRDLVERSTRCRPSGPIRLMTQLRYFGYCFNPVSFYFVLDTRAAE